MSKAEVLRNPSSCLNKANPNEPIFVLRANDPIAAQIIRLWAAASEGVHEEEKRMIAAQIADDFDAWQNSIPRDAPPLSYVNPSPPGTVVWQNEKRR